MSKSKKSRKYYEEEQASDDIYDEIDHFHMERDSILLAGTKKRPKSRTKEILSVRVDESEDDDFDQIYDEEASQMNNDEEGAAPVNVNQWGKKRANYYGTSYVDKDFGGVHDSDEEEMLELEEEDAIARQRKLDVANNYVDLDFALHNDDTQSANDESDESSTGEEDNAQANKKVSEVKVTKKQLKMKRNTTEKSEKQTRVHFAADNDIDANEAHDDIEWDQNVEEKRGISYEMQKNKGLTQKRKKGTQHSRLKKRKQYDKALIRRRSQVPDVRREERKYDGEKRGIRASTVRSIKLK
ncbi:something about silencing protein 10 [Ditylenchus destructor]|uniref:Something about silencing protein 10 n=1 Tax=Ditylenchus destructor TaxID=166010 RepID=A0AAD4NI72_9BILA|nr:something about silencing protein 10 [Ditylenchus destructor]